MKRTQTIVHLEAIYKRGSKGRVRNGDIIWDISGLAPSQKGVRESDIIVCPNLGKGAGVGRLTSSIHVLDDLLGTCQVNDVHIGPSPIFGQRVMMDSTRWRTLNELCAFPFISVGKMI